MILKRIALTVVPFLIIGGCGSGEDQSSSLRLAKTETSVDHTESTPAQTESPNKECPNPFETVEWVDMLMINDIQYVSNYNGTQEVTADETGPKVGEVRFNLSKSACSHHIMRNGDAAFLPVGTEVYELKGYKPDYRIVADHKIYEVSVNHKAHTIGDLLDIKGKVQKVSRESGYDGSHMWDFEKEASEAFIQDMLQLKYVGFEETYKKTKHENGVFLRVHLQDGTSFRIVYYVKANAISPGAFGTEKMRQIVLSQKKPKK